MLYEICAGICKHSNERGTTHVKDVKLGMCVQDVGRALQLPGALVMLGAHFIELLFAFMKISTV